MIYEITGIGLHRGIWRVDFRATDTNGVKTPRVRKEIHVEGKDEALAIAEQMRLSMSADVISVSELLDVYIVSLCGCVSEGTIFGYRKVARRFARASEFGASPIARVDLCCVTRYLAGREEVGAANNTIRQEYSLLKAAFGYAVHLGLVSENPVEQVACPVKVLATPSDEDEKVEIVGYLGKLCGMGAALGWLAYDAGLRTCELAALRKDDFGRGLGAVHVRRHRTNRGNIQDYQHVRTKTLGKEAKLAVGAWLFEVDGDYVFGGKKPYRSETLCRRFNQCAAAFGLDIKLDGLRKLKAR